MADDDRQWQQFDCSGKAGPGPSGIGCLACAHPKPNSGMCYLDSSPEINATAPSAVNDRTIGGYRTNAASKRKNFGCSPARLGRPMKIRVAAAASITAPIRMFTHAFLSQRAKAPKLEGATIRSSWKDWTVRFGTDFLDHPSFEWNAFRWGSGRAGSGGHTENPLAGATSRSVEQHRSCPAIDVVLLHLLSHQVHALGLFLQWH